jgi:hypothetical protein
MCEEVVMMITMMVGDAKTGRGVIHGWSYYETLALVSCHCIVEFFPLSVRSLSYYVAIAHPLVERAKIIILIHSSMR